MIILGIHVSFNGFSHDSSACIIKNKKLIAAAEEERFNRVKSSQLFFPHKSIKFTLEKAKIKIRNVDLLSVDGSTFKPMKFKIKKIMNYYFGYCPKIEIVEHPISHSYGSFISSGFKKALVVSVDGVGDGTSTMLSIFEKKNKKIKRKQIYKDARDKSLGDFYGIFTNYLGFRLNEGEYKVMGMAALGKPLYNMNKLLYFNSNLQKVKSNISKILSLKNLTNTNEPIYNSKKIRRMFNVSKRLPSTKFKQEHFNLAASVQLQFTKVYVDLVKHFANKYKIEYLCLSGGCALNSLANQNFLDGTFKKVYVMPAASDRGLSIGNAMYSAAKYNRIVNPLRNMFLGPSYSNNSINKILKQLRIKNNKIKNCHSDCAAEIKKGKIIGWFQGRSEFGPRALGSRSIIANPKIKNIRSILNLKIKNRESYRPFAPSILNEDFKLKNITNDQLEFMTFSLFLDDHKVKQLKEAVHYDNSSRVHVVNKKNNKNFYELLRYVKKEIGIGCVINTSFNLNNEPIVNSPTDAIKTFFGSGIDILYIGNYKIIK
tara:strand:- start:2331 stop:3956 length:1626 start_codon:yes stop_codon:yes gene_type:complete